MPTYTVASGDTAKYEAALAANVETRVTFTDEFPSADILVHSAASPIYFTVDGSAPVVRGGKSLMLYAGPNAARTTQGKYQPYNASDLVGPVDIRMISEGAAVVSVVRA